ncbi:cupin domain-containing protein [Aquincola tertiaricarbonis]|uniref:Cupin domain-containing protein n=1 Tax=Aquincola tertiaricarbonis TaxID=391953 RepID=A0ABY4S710_AQUTE|nr:cupin domain-containing protein [Aquincola tertiaricarbonis]URI07085.1 cupin domain-containing protein [Aquincola tertiaricarbonis]
MFKRLMGCLTCAAIAHGASAEPAPAGQKISLAQELTTMDGPAETFTGAVRVTLAFAATPAMNASGGIVQFQPGARSAWHTHPAGQQLIVTEGVGLTQEWGKPIQQIRAGDVVWCPPGVKHWHGAAPGSAMTHIAITGVVAGKAVDWLEKVSDAQYLGR